MEDIKKKINQIKVFDEEVKEVIENIISFWEENLDIIGREIGNYHLSEIEIDTDNFQNYIFSSDDDETEIFGYGYDSDMNLGRYNNFHTFKKASRYYHQMFLSTFFDDLERKLDNILVSNESEKIRILKEKIKSLK